MARCGTSDFKHTTTVFGLKMEDGGSLILGSTVMTLHLPRATGCRGFCAISSPMPDMDSSMCSGSTMAMPWS